MASGHQISHYRLLEKLGEGGMGVVWKAEDTILGRAVAIKVLPADLALDEARRRMFLDEARLASSVSDARIVQVYELGREGDLDFIVMEYVEGEPLNHMLRGRALSPERVAALGEQVARALSRAHRKKLLHRDLKPSNILVTPDGDVKVVDFGLATLFAGPASTRGTEATTVAPPTGRADDASQAIRPTGGSIAGTLPYMSPEQVKGETLDARSDIFSLGSVLYEMTTGHRPFTGAMGSGVVREILTARPVPVHDRVSEVPLELDRIIQKAMAVRRAERYQTMDDLAIDLRRLGRDLESGSAPSYDRVTVPPARLRGRRALAWTSAGAIFLIATVAAVWLVARGTDLGGSPQAGGPARTLLILPLEVRGSMDEAAYVGDAFAEIIAVNLAQSADLKILPVPGVGEVPVSGAMGVGRAALDLNAGIVLTGSLSRQGQTLRVSLSLLDASENRLLWGEQRESRDELMPMLASSLARQIASKLGVTLPRLYDTVENSLGSAAMAASPLTSEAVGALQRNDVPVALEATRRLVEAFPGEVDAHAMRARSLADAWEMYRSGESRQALESGLANLERLDPQHWLGQWVRGFVDMWDNRPHAAIERLTELLARTDLGPEVRAEILSIRGNAHGFTDDVGLGLADLEAALRLSPTNARIFQALSSLLRVAGRLPEALVRGRQAVAIAPWHYYSYQTLGSTFADLRQWQDAISPLKRACDLSRRQSECVYYAIALQGAGRAEEARVAVEEAMRLTEDQWGVYNLACYNALAGRSAEALRHLRHYVAEGGNNSWIQHDPDLDSLHGDPEFEAIVARITAPSRTP